MYRFYRTWQISLIISSICCLYPSYWGHTVHNATQMKPAQLTEHWNVHDRTYSYFSSSIWFTSCSVAPPPGVVPCDSLPLYSTPKCTTTCTDTTYESKYNTDKHLARTSYSVKGMENIQMELMEKGTITVAFMVYEDFELYSSGVYQHVKGDWLIGWDVMRHDVIDVMWCM